MKPGHTRLLTMHLLRRERVSPHFMRVTLGGGDIGDFEAMGYDQWFRLFIPTNGGTLEKVPDRLDMLSYLRFMTTAKATRPVLRAFSVRAFRADGPDGPELDVDFVLHGSPDGGAPGPAVMWAQTAQRGDTVGILDEGLGFRLPDGVRHLRIVADETGLPATANILASLPAETTGEVLLETPDGERQSLAGPAGIRVSWLPRHGHDRTPGQLALAEATAMAVPEQPWFGWTVGEHSLATGVRRHLVSQGQPKDRLMFCGYWRASRS